MMQQNLAAEKRGIWLEGHTRNRLRKTHYRSVIGTRFKAIFMSGRIRMVWLFYLESDWRLISKLSLSKKVLRLHNQIHIKQTNRPPFTEDRTDFVWPNKSADKGVPIFQDCQTRFFSANGITLTSKIVYKRRNFISGQKPVWPPWILRPKPIFKLIINIVLYQYRTEKPNLR